MTNLKQIGSRIKGFWSKLTLNQKVIGSGVGLLIVIALIILLFNGKSSQPMEVLYADLTEKDAAAIVEKLEEEKIPYQLEDQGATILVPSPIKYSTRLKLAAEDLPQGHAGLELFRETSFGETQMDKKVKYQEALQGELARTIQSLDKVKAANVILAMPEETLFSDNEEPTKASVVIRTHDNQTLTAREVQGIINLVSNSVEGLTPENVVIIDQYGNLLSDTMMLDGQQVTSQVEAQMLMKRAFEKEKEKAIQTMLDKTLGQDNSVVRVNADLIFDSKEQKDERYFHDEGGPFIRSQSITRESSTQTNANQGGVPGTDTNIPEYLEINQGNGESTYDKETKDINYEINRTETVTKFSPGTVDYKYLTVSVLVNRSSPQQESLGDTEEERIEKIRSIVASATGLRPNSEANISLEDQISVALIDFYTEPQPEPEPESALSQWLQSPFAPVLIALSALLLLVLVIVLMRKRSTAGVEGVESEGGFESVAEEELRLEDLIDKSLTPEEREKQRIRQEVEKLIETNPEDAVQVVRAWLAEDSR